MVEGWPVTARPSAVLQSARIRYERHRQDKIDVAVAIANLVLGGFSTTPQDPLTAVAHLFTDEELTQIKQEREEREQMAVQQAQIMRLMAWQKKLQ